MTTEHARRGLVAGLLLAAAVSVSAQPNGPSKTEDVLPALLTEVRGLRAAMEQMASAGPRVQLFVSRLQLQESRINSMARRLDTVRDDLAKAQRELQASQDEQEKAQASLDSGRSDMPRDQLVGLLRGLQQEATQRKATVSRLTAEEAQLSQDIAGEQARWTEINSRLDDLERALARK